MAGNYGYFGSGGNCGGGGGGGFPKILVILAVLGYTTDTGKEMLMVRFHGTEYCSWDDNVHYL